MLLRPFVVLQVFQFKLQLHLLRLLLCVRGLIITCAVQQDSDGVVKRIRRKATRFLLMKVSPTVIPESTGLF